MELKLRINTPKGMARSKSLKLKALKLMLFRKAKVKKETIGKENDHIIWQVELTPREYPNLIRKVGTFKFLVKQLKKNKLAVKALKRMADTPEVYKETMELLEDGTNIEVVRNADTS